MNVRVPYSAVLSYTLYAQGARTDFPVTDSDGSFITFRFDANGAVALFYTFAEFRRAYLVTGHGGGDAGIRLPGVEEPVSLIYTARGRRLDLLKGTLRFLETEAGAGVYLFPAEFWRKIAASVEFYGAARSGISFLLGKYRDGGECT